MQENFNLFKDILNDIRLFFKKPEDFKKELIQQLITGCPQKTGITLEEYTIQEEVKHYLAQLYEISIDDMNTIYKNYSFIQIMEQALGDKICILSDETYEWMLEIDSALSTFSTLPQGSEALTEFLEESTLFDENDLSG